MPLPRKFHIAAPLLCLLIVTCIGITIAQQKDHGLPTDTNTLWSSPGPTFQIAEAKIPDHWSLIAYGDMRFTDPTNEEATNPKVRRWLVERIAEEHPDALLLSGDVPYNGSVVNDYEVYREETASWRRAGLRVYPAIGNHELRGDQAHDLMNWWNAFPEFKNRRWYSVAFKNVYLITLDSNLPLTDNSPQQKWLIDQLDHLPQKTQFVFFSLHHPPVADSIKGNHSHDVRPNEQALAELLEKRAPGIKAKFIVIAGHIHNYERFFVNGITYLVSGGGGAKPYPIERTAADLYQDQIFPNYHYLEFNWDGKQLKATMFRVSDPAASTPKWEVRDNFVINP